MLHYPIRDLPDAVMFDGGKTLLLVIEGGMGREAKVDGSVGEMEICGGSEGC